MNDLILPRRSRSKKRLRATTRSQVVGVIREAGIEVSRFETGNFLTDLGEAHIADRLSDAGTSAMSHMAIGTGSGQDNTDTTLDTEIARVALDATYPKQGTGATDAILNRVVRDNEVLYRATFAAGTGTGTITELGILNAASVGVLLNYATTNQPKSASQELILVVALTIGSS